MKKFLLTLLFLIVLGIATGAYFLARSLNSDTYQQQIIAAVSELTGRRMVVTGQTTLKWMPYPTVVMTGVYLTNHPGSEKNNMISADRLQIEIDWGSLFKTPLVVKNIEVIKPVIYLERLESNRANWDLPFLSAPDENLNDAQLLGKTQSVSETKVDRLHVNDGTIIYVNQITKQSLVLKKVTGNLTVSSLKGPFVFNGSAEYDNVIFGGSANIGKIRNDAPIALKTTLTEKNSSLKVDFAGEIKPTNSNTLVKGDGSFTISKPQALLEPFGVPVLNDMLKQNAVGSFSLEINPLNEILKNLILRFGEGDKAFALTTTIEHNPKTATQPENYVGEIAVNALDYKAFQPYLTRIQNTLTSSTRLLPNMDLKVVIPSFVVGNDNLKDLSGMFSYANRNFKISDGHVTLPGQTQTVFNLENGIQDGTPYILVFLDGKTTNARQLLSFIGLDTQSIPSNLLQRGEATARLTLSPNFNSILFNKLKVDTTDITGSIDWVPGSDKKLAIDVVVNNLNLDSYTGWRAGGQKVQLSSLPTVLTQAAANATKLAQKDLRFKADVRSLTWHDLPISQGNLSLVLKDGIMIIESAEFSNVATASLTASADITGIGTPKAKIETTTFSFAAAQLPLFLNRAGIESSLPLIQKAVDTKIAGSITATDNTWKTNVLLQLSDASIKVNGSIVQDETGYSYQNLNLNIIHPNFKKFLGLLNIDSPFPNLDGTLRAQGVLNGSSKNMRLTQADLSVGIQKLTGEVSYENQGIHKLVLNVASPVFEAERFIPASNMFFDKNGKLSSTNFDFTRFNDWDITGYLAAGRLTYKVLDLSGAKIAFNMKDKVFSLTEFSGQSRGANALFSTTGTLSWVGEPTLKATIDFTDVPVRPDFMIANRFSFGSGKATVKGSFTAAGNSPVQMISNLDGKGSASVTGAQFVGLNLAAIDPLIRKALAEKGEQETFDSQLNRALQFGKTPVNNAQGDWTISKGILRFMDMTIKTPTAVLSPVQMTWDMTKSDVQITMPVILNAYKQLPAIILNVAINAAKTMYTADYADLSNAVAGTISKELSALDAQAKAQEAAAQAAVAQNRQEALKQAVTQANTTVRQVADELQTSGNEKALILLQNANDALTVVNQLAIKEGLNVDQENTILEQSRLAILKANQAKEEASRNNVVDHSRTVAQFDTQATAMIAKMAQMAKDMPQISIIPRQVDLATQNLARIKEVRAAMTSAGKDAQASLLASATEAFKAIEGAYANVMRFDTAAGSSATTPPPVSTGVRGTISRN